VYSDWKYNLFTMIHARKKGECEDFVADLSKRHGLDDFAVLYSTTEYKKIRLAYFTPEFEAWEQKHVGPRAESPDHGKDQENRNSWAESPRHDSSSTEPARV
jgi:hypothetical protein